MNYAELVEDIKSYTQNYDAEFISKIPTFVRQAEQRIYNSMQFPVQRTNVIGQVTTGNPYLTTPSDWLSTYSISVIDGNTGAYDFLLNKDVNFIRESFPYPAVSGKPGYYAVFDKNTFIVGPTPNSNYAVELHYYTYPPSIATVGTSWLGDNFDSVLLYGALVEAYTFMKGEADVMQFYIERYNEALAQAKRLADGLDRQDAYRSGQVRIGVN